MNRKYKIMAEELQLQLDELKRDSTASQAKLIMNALNKGHGLAACSGSVPSEKLDLVADQGKNEQTTDSSEKFVR